MKKLIILLAFFLFACEQDTFTWQCETTVWVYNDRDHHIIGQWTVPVDASEDEIREYEKIYSYVSDTIRMITKCKY